jgi:hypothetical protein
MVNDVVVGAFVVVGAIVGALGVLGSQWIVARTSLKTRRLEIYFGAKADAYRRLMECIGVFAFDPHDLATYLRFLAAFEVALMFASDEVAEALTGRLGLHPNAQRLRTVSSEEREQVLVSTWYAAVKQTSTAMRDDLKRLSGGLQ